MSEFKSRDGSDFLYMNDDELKSYKLNNLNTNKQNELQIQFGFDLGESGCGECASNPKTIGHASEDLRTFIIHHFQTQLIGMSSHQFSREAARVPKYDLMKMPSLNIDSKDKVRPPYKDKNIIEDRVDEVIKQKTKKYQKD